MKGEKEKKVSWAKEKGKSEEERKRGMSSAQSTLQPRVFGRPRRVCGQVTVVTEHYGTSLWWVGCGERARGSIWLFLFFSHSFPSVRLHKKKFFCMRVFLKKEKHSKLWNNYPSLVFCVCFRGGRRHSTWQRGRDSPMWSGIWFRMEHESTPRPR